MLYAIMSRDVRDSQSLRLRSRPDHLARLQALKEEGRLVIAGPHPTTDSPDPGLAGFAGSLVVAEFESLADAKAWAADDPYAAAGVYASVEVLPFMAVLP